MTVGIDAPEIMAAHAKEHIKAGFRVIKTKVGTDITEDLARVKAIREAVGDDVKIRLDANQGWNAREAVELLKRLNEYDIELVEQPVRRFDFEGLKYVTANSRCRLWQMKAVGIPEMPCIWFPSGQWISSILS